MANKWELILKLVKHFKTWGNGLHNNFFSTKSCFKKSIYSELISFLRCQQVHFSSCFIFMNFTKFFWRPNIFIMTRVKCCGCSLFRIKWILLLQLLLIFWYKKLKLFSYIAFLIKYVQKELQFFVKIITVLYQMFLIFWTSWRNKMNA